MQCRSNFVSIIKRKITQFKNWKMICTHSSAKVRCKWIKIWKYIQYHRYANENDTPHPYDSYNLKDSHKFWRWYGERIRRSWNTHALVAEHKIVQTLWKLIWQFLKWFKESYYMTQQILYKTLTSEEWKQMHSFMWTFLYTNVHRSLSQLVYG